MPFGCVLAKSTLELFGFKFLLKFFSQTDFIADFLPAEIEIMVVFFLKNFKSLKM